MEWAPQAYTPDHYHDLLKEGIRILKGRDFDVPFSEGKTEMASLGDFETNFSVHGVFVNVIAGQELYADKALYHDLTTEVFRSFHSGEAGKLEWNVHLGTTQSGVLAIKKITKMCAANVVVPKGKITIIFTAEEVEENKPQLRFDINMGTSKEDMKRVVPRPEKVPKLPNPPKKVPKLSNPAMIKAAQAAAFEEERRRAAKPKPVAKVRVPRLPSPPTISDRDAQLAAEKREAERAERLSRHAASERRREFLFLYFFYNTH